MHIMSRGQKSDSSRILNREQLIQTEKAVWEIPLQDFTRDINIKKQWAIMEILHFH